MIPFDIQKYQHIAKKEKVTICDMALFFQLSEDSDETRLILSLGPVKDTVPSNRNFFIPWRNIRYIGSFVDGDRRENVDTSLMIMGDSMNPIIEFETTEARNIAEVWLVECTKLYGKNKG
ncbi:hypothetical protein MOC16_gp250 [Klebsiella phage vB_KpM_FBKp24]|uniref:Uncharacterized protein n=1 Tax=Klebsiella phage vB_KpM_FBKp24 TaxID=2801834 RepID=A0A7U0GBT3_9CAUD|nr:hypothetical protein MOC16_gp250 [Klebsiella phage vB_KpM_FBKp24]QQV92271.1 hypothetical protein vBKpMFBKp24_163 [Klebsiella phage vB_KpM_FBKp24]